MKKILLLITCLHGLVGYSQTIDSSTLRAASYFKEAEAATKNQKIWSKQAYGPTLFVEPRTRTAWANIPDSAGILKPKDGIYKGILPKEIIISNTAINWQGKKWSLIRWPLPAGHDNRMNLVLHESFHRIQESLGLPANNPTINYLNTMEGRIYFLLELQALKSALSKPIDQRQVDLTNALLFREKRHLLFPETFKNEQLLEMNEGLAEFTGVILGRHKDSIRNYLYGVIDGADKIESLIRSSAYITGPVYGYLLSDVAPLWTLNLGPDADFPALISKYYHITINVENLNSKVEKSLGQYNGASIISSEKLKAEEHQKKVKQYVDLFTKRPVLIISSEGMNIGFDPDNLFDLGEYGTVYPTAQVKDSWGAVDVLENGMLLKDWKVISLPVTNDIKETDALIEDKGWKLTLRPGWKIQKIDPLHYKLIKKS